MERFEEFLQERQYLLNVSPKTLVYYKCAFKSWEKYGGEPKQWVINLRQAGLSPVSVNTYITAMNAYWKWKGVKTRLPKLKTDDRILKTLSADSIAALMRHKARGTNLTRVHMIALTILDTGLRIAEVVSLTKKNIDFDNLVIRVFGKGSKERLVPFSLELRKHLWKFIQHTGERAFIFGTKNNTKASLRNVNRDFTILGKTLGITDVRFSPHTLRHTFAVSYLKSGGNLEYLRRILGHTQISTTQKYLKSLGVEDLGEVHEKFSPLNGKK